MVHIFSLRARQHGDGITAIIFVEAARWHATYSAHHAWGKYAGHGVVVLIKAWIELVVKISKVGCGNLKRASTILKTVERKCLDCVVASLVQWYVGRAGEVMSAEARLNTLQNDD